MLEAPILRASATPALTAAVASGTLVSLQARLNGELRLAVDDALLAAVVSFGTGLLLVGVLVTARPASRAALPRLRDVPRWRLLGGLGGATLVAVAAGAAPVLGVALLTLGLVAGQTTGGLLVDRVGLGPGGRRPVTGPRLAGAALCLVAVALAGSGDGRGEVAPLLLVAVVAAGFLISVQQALNGTVRVVTGDPGAATLVNFVVGTTALVLAFAGASAVRGLPSPDWPGPGEPELYLGGAIGVVFVTVAAAVVSRLGVLRLGLAVVAGQVVGALLLDLVAPLAGETVTLTTLGAAALTLVAVGVAGRGTR